MVEWPNWSAAVSEKVTGPSAPAVSAASGTSKERVSPATDEAASATPPMVSTTVASTRVRSCTVARSVRFERACQEVSGTSVTAGGASS